MAVPNGNGNGKAADALVFFGATGDLAKKKIFPALYGLTRSGKLDMPVIGVARGDQSREQFVSLAKESLKAAGPVDEDGGASDPAVVEQLRRVGQQVVRFAPLAQG